MMTFVQYLFLLPASGSDCAGRKVEYRNTLQILIPLKLMCAVKIRRRRTISFGTATQWQKALSLGRKAPTCVCVTEIYLEKI